MLIVNGKNIDTAQIVGGTRLIGGAHRECIEIAVLNKTYEEIKALFVDGVHMILREPQAQYNPQTGAPLLDDAGQPVTKLVDYDKAEYCVAGDIIDKRDGTFAVYMGTKTDAEKEREQKEQVMLELLAERGAIV
ncbi:hypothetical protein EDD70_2985 [Hydrogenoanaerobacterium saccharovorans]|uniref:Uncharacterized protein n=1 Tax=Hydrogenoanaerobacterium saccharovorans TaxID=474960 RepID=A0A1H7YIP9_9FIRM|nr:hypothetical protein [Hydrogenoanaerobacterium saccharovorans]RPF41925.1 hypothetical protein EDD70_2985 [Hydrogenoanaerobacterium saccharovorans]SEM45970.1 hypothetical protein SAMN05216180_0068 [Hydrogenoanaerobacterium saccharovorans]